MNRKGAQDKARARIFSKLAREITVAVKTGGADPDGNPENSVIHGLLPASAEERQYRGDCFR